MVYSEIKTNPEPMNYWETINTIANYNNIDLEEAIKKYYNLTGIPSKECCEIIIHEKKLFPYNCPVEITTDAKVLDILNIPLQYAGLSTFVIAIDIETENDNKGVYYLLKDCSDLYFLPQMLRKMNF